MEVRKQEATASIKFATHPIQRNSSAQRGLHIRHNEKSFCIQLVLLEIEAGGNAGALGDQTRTDIN
tara:strand:+ start:409 stop:606 length:198 start_codon:yes stop_codon:yes gene_type:complete